MDNGACSYRRFLEGDDEGVVEIIRNYKDGLILFLNRYVHNVHVAEDLAEETFFRIIVKRPRFVVRKGTFKTWLYTIGRNTANNYLKHAGRTLPADIEDLEHLSGEMESLERAYIREEEKIVIHRALANINPDYGKVLYLKFFEDMSNDEIAAVLKKSKRQVENLIYQSKRALKSELDREEFHYERL